MLGIGLVFVLGAVATLAMGIVLARLMGDAAAYGRFAFYLSVATMAQLLVGLGLPDALMREFSRLEGAGQRGAIRKVLVRGRGLIALAGVAMLCLWALGMIWVPRHEWTIWWLSGALALTIPWHTHGVSIAKNVQRPQLAASCQQLLRPLGTVGLALLAWLLMPFTPAVAMGCMALNMVLLAAGLLFGLQPAIPQSEPELAACAPACRGLLVLALPMLVTGGLGVLMNNLDVLMLRPLAGDAAAGRYGVAVRMMVLGSLPLMAINMVSGPFFARHHGADDMQGLQRGAQKFMKMIAPGTLLCAAGLFVATPLIPWVFGDSFQIGYPLMLTLLAGVLVHALAGSSGFLLNMTGHEKQCTGFFAVAAALNGLLNWLLIPIWGPSGAAIATASSMMVWNILAVTYMRIKIGVDTSVLCLIWPPKHGRD